MTDPDIRFSFSGLTAGSLFSGIGGLDLGLERAGIKVRWQCEANPYCRTVLAHHWPSIPIYDDVRTLPDDLEPVDLIFGGYPCQDFSYAGVRKGILGDKYLWPPMRDCIRRLRPRYVLIENVAAHLSLGFDVTLSDLAEMGFDAEWSVVSACSVGAPHMRERVFCVAHTTGGDEPDHLSRHLRQAGRDESRRGRSGARAERWLPEPEMDRVAHGVPSAVVRGPLSALGNAVVPQVAEVVGRGIVSHFTSINQEEP
jgi:DNA (cytosine-5)-methyltransferase 1